MNSVLYKSNLKGNKSIKSFIQRLKGWKGKKGQLGDFSEKNQAEGGRFALKSWFRTVESKLIKWVKSERTGFLLVFFRKDSAAAVVSLATALVVLGNLNIKEGKEHFLFNQSETGDKSQELIKKRVESHTFKGDLTTAPLEMENGELKDEDVYALLIEGGSLDQNQLQYQVLSPIQPPDAKQLLSEGADVAVYEVQSGDTVGSIANEFKITVNTILWANDLDDPDMIQPGDKIFILPTTGVQHVVKSGDTIDSIAKKYSADKEKIIAFNDLTADGALKVGEELVIPDGRIETPKPAEVLPQRNYYSSGIAAEDTSRGPSIIDKNPKGGHSFPYGYCTWYVAQQKYIPWGGNAGTWLYHAKAYGASTGKTPKKGAIIVTNESWYGHVAIVTNVSGDSVTIKEMNYAGFAKVSSRTISAKSRVIKGYIY